MNFPDAFTLHRSSIATVRVTPPDLVILEGVGVGLLQFRRSHVQECSPMQVRWYRDHHDSAYEAADDDAIVVRLAVESMPRMLLGPFEHADGMAIGNAINLARRDVLFAAGEVSVFVAEDDASLVINATLPSMRMSVPVPTAQLVELAPRDDARVAAPPEGRAVTINARYTIATGLAPAGPQRWLEARFVREQSWLIGPFSTAEAASLAMAFRSWRATHPLDREATEVGEQTLLANPTQWHMRRIAVTGEWQFGFERSMFLNVWLETPDGMSGGHGAYRVRVVGTWIYPVANADGGYGHFGLYPGELRAETIDILEVRVKAATHDGLTKLLHRRGLGEIFAGVRARRAAIGFALLDIDRFKQFNDTHGHEAGDVLLQRWAKAMVDALGADAIVARWAGNRLGIVLPDATLVTARAQVETLLATVRTLGVTCSGGVVEVAPGESLGAASARAEAALDEARRTGRDRVV